MGKGKCSIVRAGEATLIRDVDKPILKSGCHAMVLWNLGAGVIVFFILSLAFVQPAGARSLDDEIKFLLQNGCANLTGTPTGALAVVCGAGGAGTSAGGGASTPQTAPSIVQERLQAAKGEKTETAEAEAEAVSELAPGINVFFSAEYEALDRDVTAFEDGYDSDIVRLTGGVDHQFTEKTIAGLAISYYNHDGDFDSGGDFDNDSYGLTAFASFLPLEQTFVQATVGYAFKKYDRTRMAFFNMGGTTTRGPAQGDYDAKEYSAGILAGYDHAMGNVTIGPRVGLDWIYNDFDGYSESGTTGLELVFYDADETSLQGRLGVTGSMAVNTNFGVVSPQVNVDWVHEFKDDQRTESFSFVDDSSRIVFQYQDEKPDRNFFEVAVGVSAVLPNGWLPYAQFRTIVGHDYLDSYVGAVGFRKEL